MQAVKIIWMSREVQARSLRTAQLIAAVATLTACGQDAPAPTSSGDDSAAAYAVVSAQLEACENQQDSCMSACGGDPGKMAQCNSQNATCQAGAQTSEAQARTALQHDADRCTNGADDDAGVDEGKGGMNGCIAQHAPKLPKCVASLVSCLHDAGKAHGGARLFAVGGCLRDADVCFLEELAAARHAHHPGQEAGASGAAGAGEAGAGEAGATGAAGSSGEGGSTAAMTAGSGGAAGGGGSECSCPSSHEPKHHDPFVPWWFPKH